MKNILILASLFVFIAPAHAGTELEELKKLVKTLSSQVSELTKKVNSLQQESSRDQHSSNTAKNEPVSLENDETTSLAEVNYNHVLSKPWWENIDISGFGAAGAYGTGSDALKEEWGFEVKEASLFIDADVWEDIGFFVELQTNRLGDDKSKYTRTGEVYFHASDLNMGENTFGLKLGRFDLPFGEEYLWQDAIDNPLIQNSASYPYGWDEGLLVYGQHKALNWIFSITDGTDERSKEDDSDKAISAKVYGDISDDLYLSFSMMRNGESVESAMEFGGSHFEPVEGSTSASVDSWLVELNAKYAYSLNSMEGYVAVALGHAKQNDDIANFDRDFSWVTIEPYLQLNNNWYSLLRYSEIGTYDDEQGYHFDGKPFAGGNSAYGYDVERFRRISIGLGWLPNPRTRVKFEIGDDKYKLINSSIRNEGNDRHFIGAEVAVGF